ncbi:hypothetical protein AAG570_000679 [Ranatra chinensis]|uniref:CHK kinase-like domain-containing protein n=1 Tax=Ranatra chinensis TaxID=642074 RepID=A0ABD0YZT8_9HEMI
MERNTARILNMKFENAVGPGQNYTSEIIRVRMEVVLGSGRSTKKSLIVKRKIEKTSSLIDAFNLFGLETEMYTEMIPQYEILMEEQPDGSEPLWPIYYGSTNNTIVFEDLKASGFTMADRHEGLDLDHALLTLKSLGRFHGMGAALVNRGRIQVATLPPYLLCRNDPMCNKFFIGGVSKLAETILTKWDEKWAGTAERLKKIVENLGTQLVELCSAQDLKLKVLNHGDCWTNNMLYKYDSDRPIAMRFVDYQLFHYNSYAWDLSYFLYSSVRPSVRHQNMTQLLGAYHTALHSTMRAYQCPIDQAPTMEELSAEMDRLSVVGLMMTCSLTPVAMASPDDAMDMDKFIDDSVDSAQNPAMYLNPKYTAAIKQDLEYFTKMGVL